jgi:hypothetical protein
MANILLNKPATASNSFAPFLPSRAVDGTITDPKNRWVASQLPAWLCVDLQGVFWVNQWIAYFMGYVGWGSTYNLSDFKLQGSLDNTNWFDMDGLTSNAANQLNRTVTPRLVRYLRIYITKGLNVNNQVSSVVDFQASEPANAPFLLSLTTNAGTISGFTSRSFAYSINVPASTNSITFTPTALQSNMTSKVNNISVANGQASLPISLSAGNNTVSVTVTSNDSLMTTTYTVTVIKASGVTYLTGLAIKTNRNAGVAYTPLLADGILSYSASVASGVASVIIKPSASNATILVNVTAVVSGADSNPITLITGTNSINIQVNSTSGGTSNYAITITKKA